MALCSTLFNFKNVLNADHINGVYFGLVLVVFTCACHTVCMVDIAMMSEARTEAPVAKKQQLDQQGMTTHLKFKHIGKA